MFSYLKYGPTYRKFCTSPKGKFDEISLRTKHEIQQISLSLLFHSTVVARIEATQVCIHAPEHEPDKPQEISLIESPGKQGNYKRAF